jgi:hypothetical protein
VGSIPPFTVGLVVDIHQLMGVDSWRFGCIHADAHI